MDAPAVAVSADGKRVAVAWMDMRSGRDKRDMWWRIAKEGRFAGSDSALSESAEGIQAHPALCMDDEDVVHAAWEDGRSGPTTIYYTNSERKGNVAISSGGRCGFPSIAVWKQGVVIAYETADERAVCRVLER